MGSVSTVGRLTCNSGEDGQPPTNLYKAKSQNGSGDHGQNQTQHHTQEKLMLQVVKHKGCFFAFGLAHVTLLQAIFSKGFTENKTTRIQPPLKGIQNVIPMGYPSWGCWELTLTTTKCKLHANPLQKAFMRSGALGGKI